MTTSSARDLIEARVRGPLTTESMAKQLQDMILPLQAMFSLVERDRSRQNPDPHADKAAQQLNAAFTAVTKARIELLQSKKDFNA